MDGFLKQAGAAAVGSIVGVALTILGTTFYVDKMLEDKLSSIRTTVEQVKETIDVAVSGSKELKETGVEAVKKLDEAISETDVFDRILGE